MVLLLFPIFILSLSLTILGVSLLRDKFRLCLIVALGIFVVGISLPLVIVLLNGITGGFIENQLSFLWSSVKRLPLADGDIYIGAGGLLLVIISTICVALQTLLIRSTNS